jgi:hypothetical protein
VSSLYPFYSKLALEINRGTRDGEEIRKKEIIREEEDDF